MHNYIVKGGSGNIHRNPEEIKEKNKLWSGRGFYSSPIFTFFSF